MKAPRKPAERPTRPTREPRPTPEKKSRSAAPKKTDGILPLVKDAIESEPTSKEVKLTKSKLGKTITEKTKKGIPSPVPIDPSFVKPPVKKERKPRSDRKMNDELFETICNELESTHLGLRTLCKEHNTSPSAFLDLEEKSPKYTERYARARKRQAEYLFDLQREIVWNRTNDEKAFVGVNHIQRDKLIADTIKYQASKLDNKRYGDKLDVDHTVKIEQPLFPDDPAPVKPKGIDPAIGK